MGYKLFLSVRVMANAYMDKFVALYDEAIKFGHDLDLMDRFVRRCVLLTRS